MAGMYPDNKTLKIFGKEVEWPGVDADGRFTNGSFSDPMVKPSFIPAETLNLVLDNLASITAGLGFKPDNSDGGQVARALLEKFAGEALAAREGDTQTLAAAKNYADEMVARARREHYAVGDLYFNVSGKNPAERFGGTWTRWGEGRAVVGVAPSGTFDTVEKEGGAETHTLTLEQMASHSHTMGDAGAGTGSFSDRLGSGGKATGLFSQKEIGGYNVSSGSNWKMYETILTIPNHKHSLANAGGGQAHNNLQPYITCYIWKRTV